MHSDSYDFTAKLVAALVFIGMSQAITVFLNVGANMQKTVDLYRTLQEIVDSEGMWRLSSNSSFYGF